MKVQSATFTTGSTIKLLRTKIGLSQEELGKYLKVHREVISNYETGGRQIPLTQLERLADLFGVDLIDLLEPSSDTVTTNVAFAFRADSLHENDLESIADFRKIVKNYMKIKAKYQKI